MQTKLFECLEAPEPRPAEPPSVEKRNRSDFPGAVVVRSSRKEIYGVQRNEFWINNGLSAIDFADLVLESSGHSIIPIDACDRHDAQLLQHISKAMTAFMKLTERSGARIRGRSINDVGKRIEYMIAEALSKASIQASVLGRPGYPDCVLKQEDRVTYLEIKTSASIQKESNKFFKTLSFSSGKKIRSDARHLLLKVQLEEEDGRIWKAVAWELRDLSTLKTRLKTEFNAGLADIAGVRLLGCSDEQGPMPHRRGQAILEDTTKILRGPRRPIRPGSTSS